MFKVNFHSMAVGDMCVQRFITYSATYVALYPGEHIPMAMVVLGHICMLLPWQHETFFLRD